MTYFDESLSFAPVAERNTDPILPEERFILELIGLERSEPDQYRKNGGVKWTFRVLNMDGSPFMFNDEPFELWRTTGVNANGVPLMNIGTQANDFASALLGRQLGVDDTLKISELRGKRMSTMVVWRAKKTNPKEKTYDLASLKHVPVNGAPARPAPGQVSADPTPDDVDIALAFTKLQKQVARLKKLDMEAYDDAVGALKRAENAPLEDLRSLSDVFAKQIEALLDD